MNTDSDGPKMSSGPSKTHVNPDSAIKGNSGAVPTATLSNVKKKIKKCNNDQSMMLRLHRESRSCFPNSKCNFFSCVHLSRLSAVLFSSAETFSPCSIQQEIHFRLSGPASVGTKAQVSNSIRNYNTPIAPPKNKTPSSLNSAHALKASVAGQVGLQKVTLAKGSDLKHKREGKKGYQIVEINQTKVIENKKKVR